MARYLASKGPESGYQSFEDLTSFEPTKRWPGKVLRQSSPSVGQIPEESRNGWLWKSQKFNNDQIT